jgi:hypothetical protein
MEKGRREAAFFPPNNPNDRYIRAIKVPTRFAAITPPLSKVYGASSIPTKISGTIDIHHCETP